MIRSIGLSLVTLLGLGVFCSSACIGTWRPPLTDVTQEHVERKPDLTTYLRADGLGRRRYQRREIPAHKGSAAIPYIRSLTKGRMTEGSLLERKLLPINQYLQPAGSPATPPADQARPTAPLERAKAFLFDLVEPMEPMPPEIEMNHPFESSGTMRYYRHTGQQGGTGTLTRRVEIEGFEDISCPAGRFNDCLRVRVDWSVRFGWWTAVDWSGYLWLSPQVGEVRRVQSVSGWFLIFWFGSAHEYQLVSYDLEDRADHQLLPLSWLAAKWTAGVVLFDRILPRPQVAGMVIDFATNPPNP